MAGSFFEPLSFNFGKSNAFLRYSNDISTIFFKSLWGQTCQKCQKPICLNYTEVHVLANSSNSKLNLCFLFYSKKECKNNCNGHGYCLDDGKCVCIHGYKGDDCSSKLPYHCDLFCPIRAGWGLRGYKA